VPSDPNRPNRWWIAPVLGAVVVVTAVAAVVAHGRYQRPTAADTPPVVVATGSSSVPSSAEPGPGTVSVTPDVLKFTAHAKVQQVFQTYFDAINTKRYAEWRSVVTSDLADEQSESAFVSGYQSTRDGSILLYRVDTAPDNGLRVLVTFHSTQDPADAPSGFAHQCIEWQVVKPLTWDQSDNTWKIDAGILDGSPLRAVC
jgi:hypothetical protein